LRKKVKAGFLVMGKENARIMMIRRLGGVNPALSKIGRSE